MSVPRALINNGSFKSFLLVERFGTFVKSPIARTKIQRRGLFVLSKVCSPSDKSKKDSRTNEKEDQKTAEREPQSQSKPAEEGSEPQVAIAISTEAHLFPRKVVTDSRPARVIPPESEGEDEKKRNLKQVLEFNMAPPTVVLIPRDVSDVKHMRPMFIPPMDEEITEEDLIPPTNCCMSGCSNCVWIDYVEKLTKFYSSPEMGKERVHREVENIDDPNIKAWLIMDLKFKKLW